MVLILPSNLKLYLIYVGQPSCFHCGEKDFSSLCTCYAILPPPPHNKIFMMGNFYSFFGLSFYLSRDPSNLKLYPI